MLVFAVLIGPPRAPPSSPCVQFTDKAANASVPSSSPLWPRAVVLLFVLVVIKLGVIGLMTDQLFTAHWRWMSKSIGWFDYINYWLFTGLLAGSLILLGRQARGERPRVIKGVNASLVAVGLIFALLMRQQFERNYLYTYMTGLLDFAALRHYVYLDLCFARPFLIIYLALFAFLYWVWARTGREHWSFYALAGLAIAYLGFNQADFDLRDGKWVLLNCLAIAGFVSYLRSRGPLHWAVALLPLLLIATWWLVFAPQTSYLETPHPYLLLLLAITGGLFLPMTVGLRGTKVNAAFSHFLPVYLLGFVWLTNANFSSARNYDMLFGWALTVPHYFIDELLLLAVAVAVGWVALRLGGRRAVFLFDVTALLLIGLTLADFAVLRQMGTRLDWNLLTMSDDLSKVWSLIQPHVWPLLLGLGLLGALYGIAHRGLYRFGSPAAEWIHRRSQAATAFCLSSVVLMAVVTPWVAGLDGASHHGLVRIVQSSPLLKRFSVQRWNGEELIARARALQLEGVPSLGSPATSESKGTNLNVVLIIMESSYNRYLSLFGAKDETQPGLAAFRDRMELFPNIFSTFPNSLHARFSIYSGLYPTVEYPSYLNPRIPSPSLFELLHDAGYTTELYYSSTRHYTRMNDYLGHRKIDLFHDCDTMPGRERYEKVSWGISETATLEAMKAQLTRHAQDTKPFLLSYIPAAPHQPFEKPAKEFQKFDDSTARVDHNYTGAYQNQLLYMDWIIASLVKHLQSTGLLDKTIVIITNDHGEMIGEEDGKLGHGWSLNPELCNTPLIVMDPRRRVPSVNPTFGSQVDLLPTVLDLLGLPLPAGELYQGLSLYDPQAQQPRPIYLQSYRDRAMVLNGEYLWLENYREGMDENQAITRRFTITNEAARTIFTEVTGGENILRRHLDFEQYQHSFIVHYGSYRDQLATSSKRSAPDQPAEDSRTALAIHPR